MNFEAFTLDQDITDMFITQLVMSFWDLLKIKNLRFCQSMTVSVLAKRFFCVYFLSAYSLSPL